MVIYNSTIVGHDRKTAAFSCDRRSHKSDNCAIGLFYDSAVNLMTKAEGRRFLRVSGKKFAQQIPNVISVKQLREKYENVMQCSVDKEIFKKFLGGTYCLKAFLSKYN